jgi:hypothetical protein
MGSKAIVRSHPERIDGVSRTWFEWVDEGADLVKVLVAEVDFDTDPNSTEFQQSVIDAIKDTAHGVLRDETTMIVSHFELSSGRGSRTPSWAQGATVTGRVNRLALPRPRPSQEGTRPERRYNKGGAWWVPATAFSCALRRSTFHLREAQGRSSCREGT